MSIEVSVQDVKELRDQTGAGMMDCKRALQDAEGNTELAIENLRKKGLASAAKKSNRITAEGLIESYIHTGSKVGVLVELNCETDFVSRSEEFHQLAKDIAMQIVACPLVQYVSVDEIDEYIIQNERRIELEKEDLINKPKSIKEKIVDGRIEKRLKEISLMHQPFIKNQNLLIDDLIKENIARIGENIKIRRFQKFSLGDGLQKRSNNFASEVAGAISNS